MKLSLKVVLLCLLILSLDIFAFASIYYFYLSADDWVSSGPVTFTEAVWTSVHYVVMSYSDISPKSDRARVAATVQYTISVFATMLIVIVGIEEIKK